MSALSEIEWEECLLEPRPQPELEARFRQAVGRPGTTMRYLGGPAWVGDAVIDFSVQLETRVHLDADLADLCGMAVSRDNACRYCFAATRALLRLLGMPERRIAQLEQEFLTAEFSPRERVAIEFARRVSRSNPLVRPGALAPLREAGFGDEEIAELAGVVFLHLFSNRLSTIVAIPPEGMEALPDRWTVRLARPLLALFLRRLRRRARPERLAPGEADGPFAPVVSAFDGLPLARVLRRTFDGACSEGDLSRRAKALVFAVVGRALGCPLSEREATRLLADEGLSPEEIRRVLEHLAAPGLDRTESLVAPFARETVWYQPAHIQQRAREVLAELPRGAFVELVATAALANATCRVGFLAMERG